MLPTSNPVSDTYHLKMENYYFANQVPCKKTVNFLETGLRRRQDVANTTSAISAKDWGPGVYKFLSSFQPSAYKLGKVVTRLLSMPCNF